MIVFSDIGSDSGEIECGDSRFGAEYKTQRAKINNLIKDVNAKLRGVAPDSAEFIEETKALKQLTAALRIMEVLQQHSEDTPEFAPGLRLAASSAVVGAQSHPPNA